MDIISQFKVGFRTSEFWVGLIATLGPLVAVFTGVEFDTEGAVALVGMFFTAASYIGGRTWLKTKRLAAVVDDPVITEPVPEIGGAGEPAP